MHSNRASNRSTMATITAPLISVLTSGLEATLTAALTAGLLLVVPGIVQAQDADRVVASGGITVAGWRGVVDPAAAANGARITDARLASEDDGLRVTTGPAVTYWREDERLTGDYTVRATFTELEYLALNNHPHPYGIIIAGNGMSTERQSLLYCMAYGNGNFIVRGFGPEPFQMNGRRGEEHAAVNRAAGKGQPVTQEIALSVRGDTVECAINGTVVARYARADLVAPGRLTSTDGFYGIRFGHNTDVRVTGLVVER